MIIPVQVEWDNLTEEQQDVLQDGEAAFWERVNTGQPMRTVGNFTDALTHKGTPTHELAEMGLINLYPRDSESKGYTITYFGSQLLKRYDKREELPKMDVVPAQKPTYYFTEDGRQVSYIEHAAFINSLSYVKDDLWVYPMLTFKDLEDHYEVWLIVTSMESKPILLQPIGVT